MDKLVELLRASGVLTPQQALNVQRRMERTGQSAAAAIIELEYASEEAVYSPLAQYLNTPLYDPDFTPPEESALKCLPSRAALELQCLPIKITNAELWVAAAAPLEANRLDQLRLLAGRRIIHRLIYPSKLRAWLSKAYGIGAESLSRRGKSTTAPKKEDSRRGGDEGVISQVVDEILRQAVANRATDIHLEPYAGKTLLRFRIDGMLRDMATPEGFQECAEAIVSRVKVMAQLNIAEKRLPQDGRLALSCGGISHSFRVSVLPTRHGEALCMRFLNQNTLNIPMEELGLEQWQLQLLREQLQRTGGIMLVTGPTGSGKTTTLYSALSHLKQQRPELKTITVEDPVEYDLPGITQIQIAAEIGLDFSTTLRSILRHDPDIILVGEIRDGETAQIAIQAAMTGHLVLSTIHTCDSVGAVSRLINMGVDGDLVAGSLNCVISQRLLRRLCPHCATAIPISHLTQQEQQELQQACANNGMPLPQQLFTANGCAHCGKSGYSGRTAIYEFLVIDETLEDHIASATPNGRLRAIAKSQGYRPFRESAWLKVAQGITSAAEVQRVTTGKYTQ